MKFFCIEIHTERLHDDSVWREVEKVLHYFSSHHIKATWFSINPTFVGYRAMGFDEDKWRERLQVIKNYGQDIQQHTHFYKGKEGLAKGEGYDMTSEHINKRLLEDKQWLEVQGFYIKGFSSGAWKVSEELFQLLHSLGYNYDSSIKGGDAQKFQGVIEIPVSSKIGRLAKGFLSHKMGRNFFHREGSAICVVSFHDYDVRSYKFRFLLLTILRIFKIMHFHFVNASDHYEKFK
jgi:predicted deacetylase